MTEFYPHWMANQSWLMFGFPWTQLASTAIALLADLGEEPPHIRRTQVDFKKEDNNVN
jgi:hypothetical protein